MGEAEKREGIKKQAAQFEIFFLHESEQQYDFGKSQERYLVKQLIYREGIIGCEEISQSLSAHSYLNN